MYCPVQNCTQGTILYSTVHDFIPGTAVTFPHQILDVRGLSDPNSSTLGRLVIPLGKVNIQNLIANVTLNYYCNISVRCFANFMQNNSDFL